MRQYENCFTIGEHSLHDRLLFFATSFIKDYRDDLLIHDKNAIEDNPNIPFLHFTGESGTIIEFLIPFEKYPKKGERIPYLFGTADRQHILEQIKEMVFAARKSTRQDLILYYDGMTNTHNLFDITQDKAEDIVTAYYEKILALFV
ncbi:MAG TPA: hypothetical protein VMX17_07180 [Candidatus Glassbacteria bacterium]|nr:hypothetical protein [Candidatus Glassbacteria bacterium]